MMINQLSKVGIGTTSQLIVRIGAPYQQWLDHSHFCHLRLAPRSLHQCANSTCWTENNHNVVQIPNTHSVYYYRRLIIPLQYQILGAGDVVINWFLVLQCMAIATAQPCQDKKNVPATILPKNPDFKFDSAPKIPAVLITSWVQDLIIKFIGCISSPESRQSKTVLRCWVLWGNNGGSK